ncbi:MAG: hypothetical protein H6744_05355 [Deltaproteobacteria bacterium]|nr:hypothetical protein [Deltaproteobacteria bacterium]MCB9786105.1 hypothetical protein [Deltaproteobacteria bacterium]
MRYADYVEDFSRWASLGELGTYGEAVHDGTRYPYLRLVVDGARWLTITAGFHGDEQSGPRTLLRSMDRVVAWARQHDVGLRVYPCLNPTGFEDTTRYNRAHQRPNNDLLRYELPGGHVRGELLPGQRFKRWYVRTTPGAAETDALLPELEQHAPPVAALDLHQDPFHEGPGSYAYVFGERSGFHSMVRACRGFAPIVAQQQVDDVVPLSTDEHGLLEYADGSITDYFWRRGVRWAAALETTTDTDPEACHQVNLAWIHGFIERAAAG